MPTCIFVLQRFTLRVDNVLFRVFDTRFYHSFTSSPPLIVRETSGWEAPYNDVKRVRSDVLFITSHTNLFCQFLPKKNDLTPLTDANFIGKTLTMIPKSISQGRGAGTGWRALGTSVEIARLLSKDATV